MNVTSLFLPLPPFLPTPYALVRQSSLRFWKTFLEELPDYAELPDVPVKPGNSGTVDNLRHKFMKDLKVLIRLNATLVETEDPEWSKRMMFYLTYLWRTQLTERRGMADARTKWSHGTHLIDADEKKALRKLLRPSLKLSRELKRSFRLKRKLTPKRK